MRDLASIVTVESVQKMFEKDRIVAAHFVQNGFEAIVPSTVKVGDTLAFIQEGSILPEVEAWEFLRKRCYSEKEKGFIIRPMTMGAKDYNGEKGEKVKSWGLAVSLDELPIDKNVLSKLKAGDDITDLLNIRKYEPVEDASPTRGDSKKSYPKWVKFCLSHVLTRWIGRIWQKNHQNSAGGFPSNYCEKSDETSIQNMKNILVSNQEVEVYVTQKLEGQSFTAMLDIDDKKHKFFVCSRNNAYKLVCNNDFWTTAKRYNIENKLKELLKRDGVYYIIQGEQCGPGIQNNIYQLKNIEWFIYTIKTFNPITKENIQLSWDKIVEISEFLGIKTVPFVCKCKLSEIAPDINTVVAFTEKQYWRISNGNLEFCYKPKDNETLWNDYAQAEGIVVRSLDFDKSKNKGFSWKCKNIQYQEKGLSGISSIKWK